MSRKKRNTFNDYTAIVDKQTIATKAVPATSPVVPLTLVEDAATIGMIVRGGRGTLPSPQPSGGGGRKVNPLDPTGFSAIAGKRSAIFSDFVATADGQTLTGTAQADVMNSTYNRTTLIGGDGSDSITTKLVGKSDWDELYVFQQGDGGIDTMKVQISGTAFYAGTVQQGGSGNDVITSDIVLAPIYQWWVYIESYAQGGDGDDNITMSAVAQEYGNVVQEAYGGAGNDVIAVDGFVYSGNVTLYAEGGIGDDRITATQYGTWRTIARIELHGGDGADILTAVLYDSDRDASARLYGGEGDDTLKVSTNYAGNESFLYGGAGNDLLVGSAATIMEGGAGADRFQSGNSGYSIVTDFNFDEGDRIIRPVGSTGINIREINGDTRISFGASPMNGPFMTLENVTGLDASLIFA